MSEGNSQCKYLQKMSFFFFYKIREQDSRTGPSLCVDTSDRVRMREKGVGG
jgi:hypothetical protein